MSNNSKKENKGTKEDHLSTIEKIIERCDSIDTTAMCLRTTLKRTGTNDIFNNKDNSSFGLTDKFRSLNDCSKSLKLIEKELFTIKKELHTQGITLDYMEESETVWKKEIMRNIIRYGESNQSKNMI